jgi:uncharacterized SAM-binding protein YcdF (DUF218 family)
MIYLNKILPVFVSPIFIVLMCLAIGVMTRRRTWAIVGVVLLYIASMPIAVDFLTSGRDRDFERLLPVDAPISEAVVVLGQGMSWVKAKNGYLPDWGDPDRFFSGVELVLANTAPKLVFTGGKLPWQQSDETEGEVLSRYAQMMQVPADKILITEPVENTEQEARAVRKVLGQATKRIILVTSGFHMQRAKGLFEQNGFEVFAYPVDLTGQSTEKITVINFLPNADALARASLTLRELLGRFYYQLKHLLFFSPTSNE